MRMPLRRAIGFRWHSVSVPGAASRPCERRNLDSTWLARVKRAEERIPGSVSSWAAVGSAYTPIASPSVTRLACWVRGQGLPSRRANGPRSS